MGKISSYPNTAPVQATDEFIARRGTGNVRLTWQQIFNVPNATPLQWANFAGTLTPVLQKYTDNHVYIDNYDGPIHLRTGAGGALNGSNSVVLDCGKLSFPPSQLASSDPNTLDDYEEGSYTPSITPSSGAITSYTSSGLYTRAGNINHVRLKDNITNAGTGGGNLNFTLPFSAVLDGSNAAACVGHEFAAVGYGLTGITNGASFAFVNRADAIATSPIVTGHQHTISITYA